MTGQIDDKVIMCVKQLIQQVNESAYSNGMQG